MSAPTPKQREEREEIEQAIAYVLLHKVVTGWRTAHIGTSWRKAEVSIEGTVGAERGWAQRAAKTIADSLRTHSPEERERHGERLTDVDRLRQAFANCEEVAESLHTDRERLRARVEELEGRIVDMALTPDQEHVEATLAEYGITESTLGISTYRSLVRALTNTPEEK